MLEHERPIDGRDRYLTVYSIMQKCVTTIFSNASIYNINLLYAYVPSVSVSNINEA